MGQFKNTITGDIVTAHGPTIGFLKQQGEGVWVELDAVNVDDIKGKALDDALKANDLPTSGTADDKRDRLAQHLADEANSAGADDPDPDEQDDPPNDPSQDQ